MYTQNTSLRNAGLISRAALALDQIEPGWENKVDIETLDLCSPHNCILGQVFNSRWVWKPMGYSYGLEKLIINLGFYPSMGEFAMHEWYAKHWINEIEARRSRKAVVVPFWKRALVQPIAALFN